MKTVFKSMIFLLAVCLSSGSAQGATLDSVQQAEKIALSLTGKPLPDDLRDKFLSDQIKLDEIAELLSKQSDFIEYFAQYWTKLLGVQNGLAPLDLRVKTAGKSVRNLVSPKNQDRIGNLADKWYNRTGAEIDKTRESRESGIADIRMGPCTKNGVLLGSVFYYKRDFTRTSSAKEAMEKGTLTEGERSMPVMPGSKEAWGRMYEFLRLGDPNCDINEAVEVQPWWDPKGNNSEGRYLGLKYYAAIGVYNHCGKNKQLSLCSMQGAPNGDPFTTQVGADMSMEAGYLISHTVAEDRPFSEILTSQDTVMTGTYGAFMGRVASGYWGNYPGETIKDVNHAIFKNPDPVNRKHYRINRGALHAGVLTTPIYQMLTNGRRAKANRAYESFLCEKFAVPDGILPDPKDFNEDLTKRHYCDSCHRTLEPMAAFFNSWPTTGKVEYEYTDKQDDRGRFNGVEGKGVADFGKILANSERFSNCSIQRAFEFVNGRKMTKIEFEKSLPVYGELMTANNKNLRAVIKAMVMAPEFLAPKAGN